jgi:uncharacterized protein
MSIDPVKLAVSGECLSGMVGLRDMHRLAELICNDSGDASYELTFSRNEKGIITVSGNIQAELCVVCQRCLGEMMIPIRSITSIGIVQDENDLEDLDEEYEPFQAEDGKISVLKLIEDEILLGLPLSPMHDKADCPATESLQERQSVKQNPFTVLDALKRGKT